MKFLKGPIFIAVWILMLIGMLGIGLCIWLGAGAVIAYAEHHVWAKHTLCISGIIFGAYLCTIVIIALYESWSGHQSALTFLRPEFEAEIRRQVERDTNRAVLKTGAVIAAFLVASYVFRFL